MHYSFGLAGAPRATHLIRPSIEPLPKLYPISLFADMKTVGGSETDSFNSRPYIGEGATEHSAATALVSYGLRVSLGSYIHPKIR